MQQLAVAIQHILQEMNLDLVPSRPGPSSSVVHIVVSGRLPVRRKGSKVKEEDKKRVTGLRIKNWQQKECSMKQKSDEQQV